MKAYEQLLADWSEELGAGRIGVVLEHLTDDSSKQDVERFLENATGERRRMLLEEVDLVGLAFEDFEQLVDEYLAVTPRRTFELHEREPQRFLRWLRTQSLTPKQADFATYQESEYACYELARVRRQAHLSFQRLWNRSRELANEAIELSNYVLRTNPTSVWSRLEVVAATDISASGGNVVFLAAGTQIQTLWPTAQQLELIELLGEAASITYDSCVMGLKRYEPEAVACITYELIAGGFLALSAIAEEAVEESKSVVKQIDHQHA